MKMIKKTIEISYPDVREMNFTEKVTHILESQQKIDSLRKEILETDRHDVERYSKLILEESIKTIEFFTFMDVEKSIRKDIIKNTNINKKVEEGGKFNA